MGRETDQIGIAPSRRLSTSLGKLTTKKGRNEAGQFLVEGECPVREAFVSTWPMVALVHDPETFAPRRLRALIGETGRDDVPVYLASDKLARTLATTKTSPGIWGVVESRRASLRDLADARRIVISDGVKDPGNLGAILRVACGLGVDAAILIEGTVELFNPRTVRGSMGAIFRLPIVDHISGDDAAAFLRSDDRRFTLYLADSHGGTVPGSADSRVPDGWVLAIGGEAAGPVTNWAALGIEPVRLHIPLARGVESLNTAAAASILIDRLVGAGR